MLNLFRSLAHLGLNLDSRSPLMILCRSRYVSQRDWSEIQKEIGREREKERERER